MRLYFITVLPDLVIGGNWLLLLLCATVLASALLVGFIH